MFKKQVKSIAELLGPYLRTQGLETPLLQKRLVDSWPQVAGENIARLTTGIFIKNQTLFVKIQNSALRADLAMTRTQLVSRLNAAVGSQVITDIKFY